MEVHNVVQATIFHPLSLFFPFLLIFLFKWLFFSTQAPKKNLPPSPSKLPIIGNLHQLGSLPHRTLRVMAHHHGPLMLLHLGKLPTLVVSSTDVAREITKAYDTIFANRPYSSIMNRLFYNKDVLNAPYGPHWRQMRGIYMTQLLSSARVCSFRTIREEETTIMMKKIEEYSHIAFKGKELKPSCSPTKTQCNRACSLVNLSHLFASLTSAVICRVAFGRKYRKGADQGRRSRELLGEMGALLGAFNVGNYIPWLGWMNYLNGLNKRVEKLFEEIDAFLNNIVDEHMASGSKEKMDFVDILLDIQKSSTDGAHFMDRDNLKAMILGILAAGTDTTSIALEWTMSELVRHPQVMKEVQKEIRAIVGSKPSVTEDDTAEMHYLRAVIKENLRLHPPVPILVPRESTEDVKVNGYDILANTTVFFNAWAIGRDPKSWEEADKFMPERFLNSSVDIQGHDFHMIPFGFGRRGCPGGRFAIAIMELVLANLLHLFDWELPGKLSEDLDVTEAPGLTTQRKFPLIVSAKPHSL
ncbi:cytochrome P450 736A117-like [Malania oleifera]|uniref:cytochrome P450 736A117-like n=1 Tax=Malania oleifera TaxID=397392 RepID=UPI0025AE4B61|nr:cytochrome P450 736A117-like [Malania oleifera]